MHDIGCSSNNLNGRTWQSAIRQAFAHALEANFSNPETARAVGNDFKGVKLIIIDEVTIYIRLYIELICYILS